MDIFTRMKCPDIPLKHFLKCNTCGKFLTGYVVKRKKIHYYKCRTVGCGCNYNAKKLNKQFKEILSKFTFEEKYQDLIKYTLEQVYDKFNEGNKYTIMALKKNLTEVETKIEKLEEKYILEEVDKSLYQKFASKYKQEKVEIQKVFDELSTKRLNFQEFIEYTLSISLKLDSYWEI